MSLKVVKTDKAPSATETKVPVTGQITVQDSNTMLAKDFIGLNVYAPDNAKIGSISDLILSKDGKTVEGFVIGVYVAGILAAAATGEDDFDFLPETRRLAHVVRCDNAAADECDVRELVEIPQSDVLRLGAAHGKSSHATMGLIR